MNSAMGHETYWKSRIVVETRFSKKKKKTTNVGANH